MEFRRIILAALLCSNLFQHWPLAVSWWLPRTLLSIIARTQSYGCIGQSVYVASLPGTVRSDKT